MRRTADIATNAGPPLSLNSLKRRCSFWSSSVSHRLPNVTVANVSRPKSKQPSSTSPTSRSPRSKLLPGQGPYASPKGPSAGRESVATRLQSSRVSCQFPRATCSRTAQSPYTAACTGSVRRRTLQGRSGNLPMRDPERSAVSACT